MSYLIYAPGMPSLLLCLFLILVLIIIFLQSVPIDELYVMTFEVVVKFALNS